MASTQPEARNNMPTQRPETKAETIVDKPLVADDSQIAQLLARLEAAEKRVAKLQEENDLLHGDNSSGLRLSNSAKPYAGEAGGYKFQIGPLDSVKYPHLRTVTENAVDESEMIRWYAATNEHPPGSKRRLDILKIKLRVICIDARREKLIAHRKRIAAIRAKIDAGSALNDRDEETLLITDEEMLNSDSQAQKTIKARR